MKHTSPALSPALTLTSRDLRWLRHIARHGPQSSEFLYEATRDTHRCKDSALRRLQTLREAGLLRLPVQQRQIAKADFNPYVYDLTRETELWLKGRGLWEDPVRPTGHWWHGFWVSSVTAAIEIVAERQGIAFIPARRILEIKDTRLAIPTSRGPVVPDQLFALHGVDGYRSYALELDRGTEPLTSSAARKSLASSIAAYHDILRNRLHHRHYGLKSNLIIVWVFTSASRLAWAREHGCIVAKGQMAIRVEAMFPRWAKLLDVLPWRFLVENG